MREVVLSEPAPSAPDEEEAGEEDAWARGVVALTGVIASGKSTVAKMLAELGAFTASADQLAREAVAPGSPGLEEVVARFGKGVLEANGSLDRAELGRRVFADAQARRDLESIVHPRVRSLARERFLDAGRQQWPLLVYEVPLLFETGLDRLAFRAIVVVAAPQATVRQRLIQRDGLEPAEAERRISSQIPAEEKRQRADHVIENDGNLDALGRSVRALYQRLVSNSPPPSD